MTDGEAGPPLPDRADPGRRGRAGGRRGRASACSRPPAARFGFAFDWAELVVGGIAIDTYGVAIRPEDVEACREADAVLLGACGGPKWDDPDATVRPEQALFALRSGLGLFANLRPITVDPALIDASPLKPELLEGVDCLIVRELTSGLYFGRPSEQRATAEGRAAIDTLWYTEGEIRRIVTLAFELARTRRAQGHPGGQGQRARDVAAVAQGHRGGPTRSSRTSPSSTGWSTRRRCCSRRRPPPSTSSSPRTCSATSCPTRRRSSAGSLGMLPSASIGDARTAHGRHGLYEPIHGSAPDIAGQDLANPLGTILSGGDAAALVARPGRRGGRDRGGRRRGPGGRLPDPRPGRAPAAPSPGTDHRRHAGDGPRRRGADRDSPAGDRLTAGHRPQASRRPLPHGPLDPMTPMTTSTAPPSSSTTRPSATAPRARTSRSRSPTSCASRACSTSTASRSSRAAGRAPTPRTSTSSRRPARSAGSTRSWRRSGARGIAPTGPRTTPTCASWSPPRRRSSRSSARAGCCTSSRSWAPRRPRTWTWSRTRSRSSSTAGREAVYDAEHFFDGYRADRDYALATLRAARQAGARTLVLCDTNGGTLTDELVDIVGDVRTSLEGDPDAPAVDLGHPHPQRRRAGGGQLDRRGPGGRPPRPGDHQRLRRAVRQREHGLDPRQPRPQDARRRWCRRAAATSPR